MRDFFFSGAETAKLDPAGRFVIPHTMRLGLVHEGKLEVTLALGPSHSISLYRRADMEEIVKKLRTYQHHAAYKEFFTLFFSTLHHTCCDEKGRVQLPPILKNSLGNSPNIVIAGVLNNIEIWPELLYQEKILKRMEDNSFAEELTKLFDSAFNKKEKIEEDATWTATFP